MWVVWFVVGAADAAIFLWVVRRGREREPEHSTVRFYLSEGGTFSRGDERDFFVVEPITDPTAQVASLTKVGRRVKVVDLTLDEYGEIVSVDQRPLGA